MTSDPINSGAKRFAFLLPNLGGGGAERVALRLIEDSLAAGHEVDLVLSRATGELLPLVPQGVRIVDLGATRIRSAIGPFRAYLRDRRPDAVHIMMWPLTVAGIIAAKLARSTARIVIAEHTTLGRQYAGSRRNLAALSLTTRLFYPLADAILCVSHESADDLARLSGLDRAGIAVVYNPVAAPPGPVIVPPAIEALWGDDCARILTVGSLKPVKDHAMLIRAFARLARQRPARLIIVGEGDMRAELERVATEEGVADRVVMPGFTLDPWPYYASADLFVLSSNYEGFPLVLIEAMRCGLNIVSTDCESGPREILVGGDYGALSAVGDETALADAMAIMLAHPISPDTLKTRAETLSGLGQSQRLLEIMLGGQDANAAT